MFSTLLQDIGEPVQLDHRDEPGGMLAQRLQLLSQNLEVVEAHARMLAGRVETAEAETRDYADMLAEANELIRHMVAEEEGRHSDQQLQDEVNRLRDTLEATQLQAAVTEGNLRRMLAEERLQTEHMRLMQAETSMQRDEALGDLAEAYADIEALHATLADTAEYVHHLRSRALELELQNCVVSSRAARAEALAEAQTTSGWLSLDKTRHAIVEAVQEASRLPLGQRKQKIRQLQLRWHPDKNPVLKEFATEVTKLINEAIAQMPEAPPPSEPEHAAASAAGAQQPAAQQRSEERGPAGPSPRQSSDRPTSAAYAQDSAPAPQPSEGRDAAGCAQEWFHKAPEGLAQQHGEGLGSQAGSKAQESPTRSKFTAAGAARQDQPKQQSDAAAARADHAHKGGHPHQPQQTATCAAPANEHGQRPERSVGGAHVGQPGLSQERPGMPAVPDCGAEDGHHVELPEGHVLYPEAMLREGSPWESEGDDQPRPSSEVPWPQDADRPAAPGVAGGCAQHPYPPSRDHQSAASAYIRKLDQLRMAWDSEEPADSGSDGEHAQHPCPPSQEHLMAAYLRKLGLSRDSDGPAPSGSAGEHAQHPVSQSQDRLIAAYMRKLAELRMSQEADRSAPPAPAGEHSEQHNSDGNAAAPAASAYSWNLENLRMRHVTAAPRECPVAPDLNMPDDGSSTSHKPVNPAPSMPLRWQQQEPLQEPAHPGTADGHTDHYYPEGHTHMTSGGWSRNPLQTPQEPVAPKACPGAPLPTAHKFASPIKLRDPCMFPPSPLLPWGQRLSHIHREQPAWLARASRQPASQL